MKNIKFSRLFAAMMFVACLVLVGCNFHPKNNGQNDASPLTADNLILGYWVDDYAGYNTYGKYDCKIAVDSIETSSYGKQISTIYYRKVTDDSGYLYYKFSEDITGYDASWNPIPVSAKGKWGAVAFKNLTATSVMMCDFADSKYELPATLDECISKYTVENKYFSKMPEWTKVEIQ